MALSVVAANNKLITFGRDIQRQYLRGNLFSPYMGAGVSSIITSKFKLSNGGEQINVPMVGRLNGVGKGQGTLVGNEEAIDQFGYRLWIDWARNAVATNKAEIQKESAPVWDQARDLLSDWGTELQRDELILAFHSIPSTVQPAGLGSVNGQRVNGLLYSTATAAQKNAWHDANSDRVLYGAATSNFVASNHAASLANIDNTADKLTAAAIDLMKRRARKADPGIKPYRSEEGREYFVLFVGSNLFRDIGLDASIISANTNARPREGRGMDNNPLFQDGDLLWRGVIIREIPEMDALTAVAAAGAGAINVAPAFLCGQAALAFVWGQMVRGTIRREDDYDFISGVGVEMAYGIGKLAKSRVGSTALTDWGMATGYFASVGD